MAIVGIVLGALWTVFRDCTALIPAGWVGDVPVIDCAKPHREEVYAVLTLSGSKYPGDTEVENQANELCNDKLDSMLTDDAELALRPPYAHARAKALVDLCSDVLVALQRRLGCASCALINLVDSSRTS
jgi:hypothetical protein